MAFSQCPAAASQQAGSSLRFDGLRVASCGLLMKTKSPGDFVKRDYVAPVSKDEFYVVIFNNPYTPNVANVKQA